MQGKSWRREMEMDKTLDILFAKNPEDLLITVRSHLDKKNLNPVKLNIIKELNNFCAVVVGESRKKEEYIG